MKKRRTNCLSLKLIWLCVLVISMNVRGYSQIIIDNNFGFGFKNIFNWNVVLLNKEMQETTIRTLMFEDINTVKKRFISIDFQPRSGKPLSNFSDPTFQILDSIPNPKSKENSLIYVSKSNQKGAFALIDHYGYVLKMMYYDSQNINISQFRALVESYVSIKIEL